MQTVEGRELADALVVTEDRDRPLAVGSDISQFPTFLNTQSPLWSCGGSPVLITRRNAARPADSSGGLDDARTTAAASRREAERIRGLQ